MAQLAEIVSFLDAELKTAEIDDYSHALNGLQLANPGTVKRVAAAVDFSAVTISGAIERGADLLVLHHGMFWGGPGPLTGISYERIAPLFEHGVAVYGSHLPLDVHPHFGNNALLAAALGLEPNGGFAYRGSLAIGLSGDSDLDTASLVERGRRFAEPHGHVVVSTVAPAGHRTKRWGMCTGAGASTETLHEAATMGLDTLIVGEGPHHTAVLARDLGIVVIYAGHYATETLGVDAIAKEVGRRFGIDSVFIPAPTGL